MIEGGVEKTYSTFEKILYMFVIPVIFTIILSLALFSLFNYDVKNTLLEYGNKIPLVGQYIPKPLDESQTVIEEDGKQIVTDKLVDEFGVDYTKEIRSLNDKIAIQESELKKAVNDVKTKEQLIKELQATVKTQEEQLKAKALTDEEYLSKIKGLADVYGSMSAGKAAPIVENLATEEAVLILNQMSTDQKKNILSKMTPARAAEISILTKDTTLTKDQEIAALQARLKIQDPNGEVKAKINKTELADTYAAMDPKAAAEILVQLQKSNANRVNSIMANMDVAARSAILQEMPTDVASTITNRIGD
jgi:flagellar motility protein MotE (MotC chaperone)